ncbi:MAG: hypothetical protein ABJA98_31130 [Acidobacteriota bacterium]
MKYMLMMHAPRAGWEKAGIGTWAPEEIKAHINFMHRFNDDLATAFAATRLVVPFSATFTGFADILTAIVHFRTAVASF